jgi:hypothetical protein
MNEITPGSTDQPIAPGIVRKHAQRFWACLFIGGNRKSSDRSKRRVCPEAEISHNANIARFYLWPPVPRQNRWSLQQVDIPRDRNVVSNVANEEMWYRQNPAPFPLEAHSSPSALRVGRMDRSGRPEGDNGIAEQYRNPSKELAP